MGGEARPPAGEPGRARGGSRRADFRRANECERRGRPVSVPISVSDHTALAQFCKDEKIELVVVGPEAPLAAGIVGNLTSAGVRCFGPTAEAAQLESSKKFAKDFMDRHGIPTARWRAFTKPEEACSFIMSADFPALVVKASGLAAGKGVIVANNKEEACRAVQEIMQCLCFTDGKTVAPMPAAQDHKRLLEGDRGPNTGGMGAYCPAPQVSKDLLLKIKNSILQRTVDGMQQEGIPYTGVLYAGIMLTKEGPKVLEFNCRFGDPECQVILPLLKSDLYEVIQSTLDGLLCTSLPIWLETHTAITVVMASKGYPGEYSKGMEITGFSEAQALGLEVFHAGTTFKDGRVVTSGGRVLTITSIQENLISALEEAKKGLAAIKFEGAIYRKDIGFRAIAFLQQPRGLTYKESGVDIAAGNMLVKKIQPLAKATSRSGCEVDLGGFAGLFDLKAAGFKDPLLASGTDGVGTKLKIAQLCNKHDTIGQDLVAMCVNDILAQGAEPLFFLDYFSCGKLDLGTTEAVVAGIARACGKAGCALLDAQTWRIPTVFSWLQQVGHLSEEEMARTFNCGIGAVLVVSKDQVDQVLEDIQQRKEEAWVIGSVVARPEGSNLQALIDSTRDPNSSAHIVVVISNKAAVAGLDKAERAGIPTRVINHKLYKNRVEFDNAIDQVLEEFSTDIVCLAGFMRILSGPFVKKWNGKMLNIHPSLLPSFKGSNAHEQVLEAGVTITGCTVHFVAEDVDAGQIILQEAVPVKRGDTVATLSERVKLAEHKIFPTALQLVASGTVQLGENGKICWVKEE
ncbi:Trifunctional purine biosynthetic protein adenosine-3 [Tupaia chinensis]|uniref:Trifunctional purine biosynthetic protein adenosine-3 n=1 Tax=Tupaia chinensis TaxID=246437 RepID=L9KH75_TUPCH|nr:Trifunctional purine biosynthetic protein adenosine-3 [Tupaia chinensis]